MHVTVERLRLWVVGAACLLVAVVVGFVLYGRYRFRHIEKDLPARLGANIQQTATGWSYSQSNQGHTLFTLKASKESQLRSGHVLLHDVDITLYGAPGSGRQDRIWGSDFDYDENHGIAVSNGDVNIELSGVNGQAGPTTNTNTNASTPESNAIRVRTSGLTFMQKTGDANTQQAVEFQLPRAAGTAVGASYNSKTGVLVLNSAVKITTSSNGRSAVVNAAHATMLRKSMQALLENATMQYEQEEGSADAATVYFRQDGTAERIDAKGHVRMKTDTGATVASQTAQVLMNPDSEPTQAVLNGGVQFAAVQPNQQMHGSAASGTLLFASDDASGTTALRHAAFRQQVRFREEIAGLPKDPQGRATKQVEGEKVDVDFAPGHKGGELQASRVTADGNPVVTMEQMPSKGPPQSTRISGDQLMATLGAGNVLQKLDGTGHTSVVEQGADGSHDTSQSDVLHASFAQQPAAQPNGQTAKAKHTIGANEQEPRLVTTLATAVQDGDVVMTEVPAKKPGATTQPATLRGWAQHAEYQAADEVLHLTGAPRINDGQTMQMAAERIDYHRRTQDAAAEGNVRAIYTPEKGQGGAVGFGGGGSGPVNIIAERAAMQHASQRTDFFGTASNPARMWQGGDTLTAPVIEIDRGRNVLRAWGEDTGAAPVVRAAFVTATNKTATKKGQPQNSAQVRSQTLLYSDKDRRADFHGAVTLEQADGVVHADDGQVFLKPEQAAKKGGVQEDSARQTSQIERIVAQGHVVFTQPGRKGEGEKLVYTADDGRYVLTGAPDALPRLWDSMHGTTTGAALLFNTQDDSVEVSGGKSSAVTQTRAPR